MGVLKIVEWSQSLQISLIGGAFVFAYIASTIKFSESFDKPLRLLFYLFAIGMVVASTGINYPILEYESSALTGDGSVTNALNGVFIAQITILSLLTILLLVFTVIGIVMALKEKKRKQQYG